ncbi:translation initiation factor IF-2 [Methylobacterium sp. SI9]|uniref:DUF1127 domain-containing protein n=1 Tax=Methylobacterium guangdongense TaxID=3138811 RepID=UPI00313D909B
MPALALSDTTAADRAASGPSLPRLWLARLWLARLWLDRLRTRRALAALHPEQIRDAGLDPWLLRAEVRKPFWRA